MPEHAGGGYEQDLKRQEKAAVWRNRLEEIEHIRDTLGFPIDANVRETIVALNLSEVPTSASCEGHIEHGRGAPWIAVEAPGRPIERFVGEDEIIERTAQKYQVSSDELRTGRNHEAWKEATRLAADNGETKEYQGWRRDNHVLQDKLRAILEEFYQGRNVSTARHLELEPDAEGTFRIHNGGDDYRRRPRVLDDEERREVAGRLVRYQGEMRAFTEFLKEKYYSSR